MRTERERWSAEEYARRAGEAGVPEEVILGDLLRLREGWLGVTSRQEPCSWPVPTDLATGTCARCGWQHAPRSRSAGSLVD
jgi:hypothetical protein